MQIITYTSEVAKPEWRWVAYIVLPNGEYLGVMFRAETENAVKAKAAQFWAEHYKPLAEVAVEAVSNHHFAGKVWVKNLTTGEKRRVLPDQISDLGSDWVRGGPRS